MNIEDLGEEQLQALDDMVELLDEAAILIRAEKLPKASQKIQEARLKANQIRGARRQAS